MPSAELSPRADEDVREIWHYTAETWSERQAQNYVDALFDTIEALAETPSSGIVADDISAGLRRQRCASHMIFYRETPLGILIVRVMHEQMDFTAHLANDDA